jgi:hypothetical protein
MVKRSGRLCFSCLALLVIALAAASSPACEDVLRAQAAPESDVTALRARLQPRFQMLPLRDGVALVPRFRTSVRSIEVSAGVIAVDGVETTGSELRRQVGADADLVLQLSYLDPASRAVLLGTPAPKTAEAPAPEAALPNASSRAVRTERRSGALVRFGGNITVPANETVTDDVVVIGGSADIDGQVEGEVVVVGGTARLGPHADIRRDVTVVGGTLQREPGAVVAGRVNEIGVGSSFMASRPFRRSKDFGLGWPFAHMTPFVRLLGTIVRVGLLILLASAIVLVAKTPVDRVAARAAAEPLKAGLIGFLLELVFLPGLLVLIVFLAVSIIGIPLLPLVPLMVLAFILVLLLGFTGVARWLGQLAERRVGWLREQPYLATILGIVVLVSPVILGRFVGLFSGFGFVGAALIGVGVLIEYVGWTVGLGAAALVRFGFPMPAPGYRGGSMREPSLTPDSPA